MALFKINKGLAENLAKNMPYAKEGFAYFTKDDGKFYIDIDGDGTTTKAEINVNRIPLNAAKADIATMIQATAMATNDSKVYPILAFNITDSTKNLVEAKYSQIGIKNGTLVIPSVEDRDEVLISNEGEGRGIVIEKLKGPIVSEGYKAGIEIINETSGYGIEIKSGPGIKVAQDPTENLELTTKQYVDTKLSALLGANDALVFKGIINGEHPLPTTGYEVGHTYRVNAAGTYAGQKCEQGDLIICIADALSTSTPHWTVAQTNIDGAVIGPNTSTANAVPTFTNETGKVIKDNPAVTIDNEGLFTAPYIATGTDKNHTHYFQSEKFRGEGNADTYYHAIDFGYAGHNQVDFHEYGGIWNFYKNTKGTAADGELVASIKPDGFHGNLKGNADTATTADKVANNLTIQLNNGTTEGTNKFTYNGSAVKNINITSSSIGAASSSHNHDSNYVKKSGDTMSGTLRVLENGIGSDLNSDGVSLANNSILLCSGGYEDYEYFQLGGTSQRPDIFIDRPGNPITLTSSLPRDENIPSEVPALSIRGNNLQNGFTFYIDKLIDPENSLDTGMGKIWLRSLTNQTVQLKGICGPTEDEDAANKYYVDNQISTKNTNLMGTVSRTYVKKTGDTMTGNLVVGSSSIGTNGYITGTWLQTTAVGNKAGDFATIDGSGWIYKRTAAQARQDMGLSTAMHFIGKATVNITDGSTVDPKINGYTTKTAGDVIIDKNNSYEYVWTLEGKWERLGPDGSYSVIGHNHDDRYSTAISITIPKGRMCGDVDGDGKITHDDITQIQSHSAGNITLTGADFWCADVNKSNSVNMTDVLVINQYLKGNRSVLTSAPTFADYYNNWTYVKVDDLTGYWTTEIATSGITTQNDIIINIFDLFSLGQFYKADILTNKIKLYATRPPIEDLKALITIRPGSGRVSIPAYSPEITLSSLGAAAQNHNHNSIYVINTGDTMTGNLAIEKRSNSTSFTTTRTDTGSSVSFMVGSDGTNRGVYDNNLNAWIIYSDGTDARTQLKLYGAVWNDYAEFRKGDTIEAGRCVIEVGDDTLIISTERMMPGANIVSDTFGFAIGETEQAKTPIAVSGRVLAYPYESHEEFKKNIGRPVCSGPNGTVSIMTDEEYRDKGYCAIGTISAVPNYEEWGTGKVKVNGRVWIKVF